MVNFEKEAKVQAWFLGMPVIFGIPALFIPYFGLEGFVPALLLFLGGWFVISAKVNSKLRSRLLIEWGPQRMLPREKHRYFVGYLLIILSVLLIPTLKYVL
ncbi:hypothetical protein AB1A81_10520 [Bdellovibrio bacteriovorus]|uniref:hypothetical protein n=1 Tax=Bdellovibrio bacteriovorus TaxID=959 RepID=UPI00045C10EB|nr:hypothetical protein [Bdellovibrio bacteriovorus]AHZ84830.1 hypothetical protein EP01_07750 [Bdellovibrio bacteriovorus]BEV68716.1 hypothetical protein Bb109J_c2136 [Bdellovibrio bacteriovorus]